MKLEQHEQVFVLAKNKKDWRKYVYVDDMQALLEEQIKYEDYLRMTYTEQDKIVEAQTHYGKKEGFKVLLALLEEKK